MVLIGFTSWIRAGPGGQTHLCEPPLPAQISKFGLRVPKWLQTTTFCSSTSSVWDTPETCFFVDSRALGLNVYNNRCPLFDFHRCLIRFIRILEVFCGFKLFYCFYSVLIGFTSWIWAGPGGQTHLCEPPLRPKTDCGEAPKRLGEKCSL